MRVKSSDVYAYHFARMWADRNSDRVHVFATGHQYDRAARREALRQNVGAQRRYRQRGTDFPARCHVNPEPRSTR